MNADRARFTAGIRLAAALCSATAVLGGISACGDGASGVTVQWGEKDGDDGDFGVQQTGLKPGNIASFGAMNLCVTDGNSAEIKAIRFKTANHIVIERYAVKTLPRGSGGLGGSTDGIAAAGFDPNERTVTSKCGVDDDKTQLAADFVANAAGIAEGKDLVVEYASGKKLKEITIPITVKLCSYSSDKCPAY